MLPRHRADFKTLLWVLVLPLVVGIQYARPELIPYLWWVSCYFALAAGTIAHNHNHCPTFASKRDEPSSPTGSRVFYGYPTFAWIPTHNLNHHKLVNTRGRRDHHLALHEPAQRCCVAATYFFVSSYYQSDPIKAFIAKAKREQPRALPQHRRASTSFWAGGYVALFALAIALHGVRTGLYVFAMAVGHPGVLRAVDDHALQLRAARAHRPVVEAQPLAQLRQPTLNFLLFNNGFHAAHHENAGAHWSKLPEAHAKIAAEIDPALIQTSLWWYWFKQYSWRRCFRGSARCRSAAGPVQPPNGARSQVVASADVDVGEAGTNAQRVQVG